MLVERLVEGGNVEQALDKLRRQGHGVDYMSICSQWLFGPVRESQVHHHRPDCAAGALDLARARVRWFLSVSAAHLPAAQRAAGQRTFRDIRVDGQEVEFSAGFGDLHTESYREILTGRGHGLEAARPAVEMVHAIRTAAPRPNAQAAHPFCRLLD